MTEATTEPQLYKHTSEAPIDTSAWSDSGKKDADGNTLYSFTAEGDPTASGEWAPADAAPETTVIDTPTDQVEVTPVDAPAADPSAEPTAETPTDGTPEADPPHDPPADAGNEATPDPAPSVDPMGPGVTPDTVPTTEATPPQPAGSEQPEPHPVAPSDDPVSVVGQPAHIDRPDAPVIEVPGHDETLDEPMVTISGTAAPGNDVVVWWNNTNLGHASTDDKGDWSITALLANGEYDLRATASDTGKLSEASDTVTFTVDHDPGSTPAPDLNDEEAFVAFLETKLLKGYPLRWELILELRRLAEAWLASRKA